MPSTIKPKKRDPKLDSFGDPAYDKYCMDQALRKQAKLKKRAIQQYDDLTELHERKIAAQQKRDDVLRRFDDLLLTHQRQEEERELESAAGDSGDQKEEELQNSQQKEEPLHHEDGEGDEQQSFEDQRRELFTEVKEAEKALEDLEWEEAALIDHWEKFFALPENTFTLDESRLINGIEALRRENQRLHQLREDQKGETVKSRVLQYCEELEENRTLAGTINLSPVSKRPPEMTAEIHANKEKALAHQKHIALKRERLRHHKAPPLSLSKLVGFGNGDSVNPVPRAAAASQPPSIDSLCAEDVVDRHNVVEKVAEYNELAVTHMGGFLHLHAQRYLGASMHLTNEDSPLFRLPKRRKKGGSAKTRPNHNDDDYAASNNDISDEHQAEDRVESAEQPTGDNLNGETVAMVEDAQDDPESPASAPDPDMETEQQQEQELTEAQRQEREEALAFDRLSARATTYMNLSLLSRYSKQYPEAFEQLEKCLSIEEHIGVQSVVTVLNLSALLLTVGKKQEALLAARRAMKIVPDHNEHLQLLCIQNLTQCQESVTNSKEHYGEVVSQLGKEVLGEEHPTAVEFASRGKQQQREMSSQLLMAAGGGGAAAAAHRRASTNSSGSPLRHGFPSSSSFGFSPTQQHRASISGSTLLNTSNKNAGGGGGGFVHKKKAQLPSLQKQHSVLTNKSSTTAGHSAPQRLERTLKSSTAV